MNRNAVKFLVAATILGLNAGAFGHGYSAGDVKIGHPYATPSPAGATTGAAYLALLENTGAQADRLLRVSTPAAARAELHSMSVDSSGVMRMRELPEMTLAPQTPIRMRPGMGLHLMLIGLKQPLKVGDSFPMTLEFERAGKVDIKVVVQLPKESAAGAAAMPGMAGHTH